MVSEVGGSKRPEESLPKAKQDISQNVIVTSELAESATDGQEQIVETFIVRSRVLNQEMNLKDRTTEGAGSTETTTNTIIASKKGLFQNKGFLSRVAPNLPRATTLFVPKQP